MALIASLVIGANGATSLAGKSSPLSTPSDRERFIRRHRSASAFIIGKNSALVESYTSAQVPIFVLTRESEALHLPHPMMEQITIENENLSSSVHKITSQVEGEIVVEAGISLFTALIAEGLIDSLELSISPIDGDGNFADLAALLARFDYSEELSPDGTRLLECRYKGNTAHS
jgi:dihydrofolate reductase